MFPIQNRDSILYHKQRHLACTMKLALLQGFVVDALISMMYDALIGTLTFLCGQSCMIFFSVCVCGIIFDNNFSNTNRIASNDKLTCYNMSKRSIFSILFGGQAGRYNTVLASEVSRRDVTCCFYLQSKWAFA